MKNLTKTRELTPKGKMLKAFILREQKQREQRKMKLKDPFESIDLRLKKVHSIIEELKKKFNK